MGCVFAASVAWIMHAIINRASPTEIFRALRMQDMQLRPNWH